MTTKEVHDYVFNDELPTAGWLTLEYAATEEARVVWMDKWI